MPYGRGRVRLAHLRPRTRPGTRRALLRPSAASTGRSAVPLSSRPPRPSPGQHVQVGRLPGVHLAARAGQQRPGSRPDPPACRFSCTPASCARQRADAASSRSSAWLRLVEVARHLERQPAARRQAARPSAAAASRWPGTHCSTALETITSTGAAGLPLPARRRRRTAAVRGRACRSACAASIISAELSIPVTSAPGQRSASAAVSCPGPQPRSTTSRGHPPPPAPTRSKNGRDRSPPKRWYWSGSHMPASRIARDILISRYSSPHRAVAKS